MSTCKHIALIHAYHDGELSPAQNAEVEGHLRACGECAAELAGLRYSTAMLRGAARPIAPRRLAHTVSNRINQAADRAVLSLAWRLTAVAAAIVVVCLVRLQMTSASTPASTNLAWESASTAGTPAAHDTTTGGDEYQLANWMVDDLSGRLALDVKYRGGKRRD